MRSKSRRFTEFCNSRFISRFAAFFIVARAKISIGNTCLVIVGCSRGGEAARLAPLAAPEIRGCDGPKGRATVRSHGSARKGGAQCCLRRVRRLLSQPAHAAKRWGRTAPTACAEVPDAQDRGLQRYAVWKDECLLILPQVHLRKPCYDFSFL